MRTQVIFVLFITLRTHFFLINCKNLINNNKKQQLEMVSVIKKNFTHTFIPKEDDMHAIRDNRLGLIQQTGISKNSNFKMPMNRSIILNKPRDIPLSTENAENVNLSKILPFLKSLRQRNYSMSQNMTNEERVSKLASNLYKENRETRQIEKTLDNTAHIRIKRHRFPESYNALITPEDFFCPLLPSYFKSNRDVLFYASNNQSMYWNGDDLIFTSQQVGNDNQCLLIDIIGSNFAEILGWKIKGTVFPNELEERFNVVGGTIKSYTVKYETMNHQWQFLVEDQLPKIFVTDADSRQPFLISEEILSDRIIISKIEFCPLSSFGDILSIHVDLFGCKLYPKDEFSLIYFDDSFKESYSCMNSFFWLGNNLHFFSNSGEYPQSASFTQEGFAFKNLPSTKDEMNSNYFLEAYLPKASIVFRIKASGSLFGPSTGIISSFTIAYLNTKDQWIPITNEDGKIKIFDNSKEHFPTASSSSSIITLPHAIVSKSLRIFPQNWWGPNNILRLDIQACDVFPIQDSSGACSVPYNLMPRSILMNKNEETILSDERARYEDSQGYVFRIQKASKWKNKNIFLRALFPGNSRRKITSLIIKGGQTTSGNTGMISDFWINYGFYLPNTKSDDDDDDIKSLHLNIHSATALIKTKNPEDCSYIFAFNPPLETCFLDLYPMNWVKLPIVRFGLRGCHLIGHPYLCNTNTCN